MRLQSPSRCLPEQPPPSLERMSCEYKDASRKAKSRAKIISECAQERAQCDEAMGRGGAGSVGRKSRAVEGCRVREEMDALTSRWPELRSAASDSGVIGLDSFRSTALSSAHLHS